MIDEADRAAIAEIVKAAERVTADLDTIEFERFQAIKVLHHAIRHLAYPDRDIYPKVRGSRKGDPIRVAWKR